MITIYTDGSCLTPQGPGGYACIVIEEDGTEFIFSEGEKITTNNRMELKAIIQALKFVKINEKCEIFSDSILCINCATGKWKAKANLDLWKEYNIVSKNKNIKLTWVKAHNGDYYNERVDKLAYNEAKNVFIHYSSYL
jgi:ribonuclease HI